MMVRVSRTPIWFSLAYGVERTRLASGIGLDALERVSASIGLGAGRESLLVLPRLEDVCPRANSPRAPCADGARAGPRAGQLRAGCGPLFERRNTFG